jgi:hypothetical protein
MEIQKAFKMLEMDVKHLYSLTDPRKATEELHSIARKQYRKLCKKYHPDTGGSEEKMKNLVTAYEAVMKTRFRLKPREIIIPIRGWSFGTTASTGFTYTVHKV